MAARQQDLFLTIKTEGAILPTDLLQRIVQADPELGGLTPDAYHLAGGEKLTEATSRSWNRLLGAWSKFQDARQNLLANDPGTRITREHWLLPVFQELGYGRLLSGKTIEIEGKSYPISHGWNRTPIHLLGCRVDLDRPTPGLAGAARSSPHSLLQEFLNRSPERRWGFVSNGLRLRILRDNASLTRQAYVEFDLEAMMQGEVYSDFVLLWLLCHESRVEAERPDEFWLEKWSQASKQRGVRALEQLREGVENAIKALGRGFLAYPGNRDLRERLRRGELVAQDYYRQVLRLVYRLLFLFAAEDRELLLLPGEAYAAARKRYLRFYSSIRLRRLAERRTGTRHSDLYAALRLVMSKLGSDTGCPELALPALGGFLFSDRALPDIENCDLSNHDLLDAARALAITVMNGVWRSVDYKNLGAEELGSVYESLLELHPRLDVDAATFDLEVAAGHERKTTGSYYTPSSLVECLLDSALNPVLDETGKKSEPELAILRLKVVDPACGSGHFLIAAAHRIAKRLASVRTGDDEPSPEALRKALRNVIGHCIYGVDVNPMSVELCKVNLWLEALEPGKPLSFLEQRIQIGNSLLGTTPRLLESGIPDEAFQPIEGDLKEACTKWRKANKSERKAREIGAAKFDFEDYPWLKLGNFAQSLMKLDNLGDDTIEGVRAKAKLWEGAVRSSDYLDGKLVADAWCAAFVWKKDSLTEYPITEEVFRRIERNPHACEPRIQQEVQQLASEYNFFHWHLAFPDVFRVPGKGQSPKNEHAGWSGGFDVVLGNPPWERVKLQETEWFSSRRAEIANAPHSAARKALINELQHSDPPLFKLFQDHLREADGETQLIRHSGRYPLTGKGDINTSGLFVELGRNLLAGRGVGGMVIPDTLLTNITTASLTEAMVREKSLVSMFGFKNERFLFEGIEHTVTFGLLTFNGNLRSSEHMTFCWLAWTIDEMKDASRRISLSPDEILLLNPNTKTLPIFRSRREADICTSIYHRLPILRHKLEALKSGWRCEVTRTFDMSRFQRFAKSRQDLIQLGAAEVEGMFNSQGNWWVPVYESKLFSQYDHRFATYLGCTEEEERAGKPHPVDGGVKGSPDFYPLCRYWLPGSDVDRLTKWHEEHYWLAFRNVARCTDERTMIATILPRWCSDYTVRLLHGPDVSGPLAATMLANLNSFVFDFVARQFVAGANFSDYITEQLPVVPLSNNLRIRFLDNHGVLEWVTRRVIELVFTTQHLAGFAGDCGYVGRPFQWNDSRRFLMKCEIDALYLHLYGIPRDDASHVLDTFPIVGRRDEHHYGEYRTKRVILEIYDAMADAERTGIPYQTRLDPPPADPRCRHASEEKAEGVLT